MRRMVINAALGRSTRARRDPEAALAVWRERAAAVMAAADLGPAPDDRAFIDDLGFLLQCFARVPDLTPLGWTIELRSAEQRLANRLRVKAIHARHPDVAAEPIERPVFIVGLPRTATSFVHRSLSRAETHRGPLLWELQRTDLGDDPETAARARKAVEREFKALTRLAPEYDAIHTLRADRPEESIALMWRTYFPLSCAPLPDWREHLEHADLTADYRYLKQALQVLQYGRERRRWILKFPGHVAHLDLIRQLFPDAVFVWTHRDPITAVASFCSLVETLSGVHCGQNDPLEIGRTWLSILADSINQGRKLRRGLPDDAIADISSHRLVSDPHRYMPQLFERIGAPWTPRDHDGLNAIARPHGRAPEHRYTPERYGLTPAAIEEAFGDYRERVADLKR